MTVHIITDVEFGEALPAFVPDTTMPNVKRFAVAAGWNTPRFTDHEAAKEQGLPGALVPGIMSQGILVAMIHHWAPNAEVREIDTIFRAPILVGSTPTCRGAVTDTDDEARSVEIDCTIVNEAGETRVVGTAIVAL